MKRLAWLLLLLAAPVRAEDPTRGVAFDPRPGAVLSGALAFTDANGRGLTLAELFEGPPVLLVPSYFHCPNLCPLVYEALAASLARSALQPGRDYRLLALSIDPQESAAHARAARGRFLQRLGSSGVDGVHFVRGDAAAITAITGAIGFRFRYDERQQQYAHAAGLVVLTPGGAVARYLFGVALPPRDLRLALTEAAQGRSGAPADRLLLLCYSYDPASGRYNLAIMNLLRAGGLLTVAGMLLAAWRMQRRRP